VLSCGVEAQAQGLRLARARMLAGLGLVIG
jgi:hypothetical protein